MTEAISQNKATRQRLPNRRAHELVDFGCGGFRSLLVVPATSMTGGSLRCS